KHAPVSHNPKGKCRCTGWHELCSGLSGWTGIPIRPLAFGRKQTSIIRRDEFAIAERRITQRVTTGVRCAGNVCAGWSYPLPTGSNEQVSGCLFRSFRFSPVPLRWNFPVLDAIDFLLNRVGLLQDSTQGRLQFHVLA